MSEAPAPLAALARRPAADPVLVWPGGAMTAGEVRARIAERAVVARTAVRRDGLFRVAVHDRVDCLVDVLAGLSLGGPVAVLDPGRPEFDADLAALAPAAGTGPALWVPTSGTTGPARIAMLPAAALDAHVAASAALLPPLGSGDRWLVCLPPHTIGALAALWRVLAAGATLAVLPRFDPAAARTLMADGASHVSLVPAMLAPLAAVAAPPPRNLRCLLSGGGPLSAEAAAVARQQGWPLWQGWGMTETCSHVAAGPVDETWQPGTVGRPLPGATLDLQPDDGRIRITGPMVMAGYAQPGGAGGKGLEPGGSLLSNDVGEWLPDGRLRLLGRADTVIVSGGVNVQPEAVESALLECPGVDEAGVTGRPDPRWGALLVAVYAGPAAPGAVAAWAASQLPSARRPRRFIRVAQLPRNAMGKISRTELAQLGLEAEAGPVG
ncbi:MAG: AMP-binding protein [Gammaproteobacteria bacterium]|jgi:O-succinylbenzoic acid--CoA ligase